MRLWQEPAVAAWHRERVAQIIKDLGDDAGHIKTSLVESFARVELIEASLADNVFALGPLTGKGRTRAAAALLLSMIDRKTRLATSIGVEQDACREFRAGGRGSAKP